MNNAETLSILQQLERGEISTAEADARLNADSFPNADTRDPRGERVEEHRPNVIEFTRWLWIIPIAVGLPIILLGAYLLRAWGDNVFLWLFCGLLPILLGAGIMALAGWMPHARWLYVNVRERKGHHIRFGLPIPVELMSWGLTIARRVSRDVDEKLRETGVDFEVMFDAFKRGKGQDLAGFSVEVDEEDERVQVYIA